MKKLIISTAFILLASSNTYSQTKISELDQEMHALGIIDSSGVYVNTELAAEYFNQAAETFSKSLPVKVNKNIEVLSVLMTPYYSSYSYKINYNFNQSERDKFIQEMLSEDSIKEMCDEIFNERIFWVNNHQMNLHYIDISHKKVVDITLNRKTCNSYILPIPKSKSISAVSFFD